MQAAEPFIHGNVTLAEIHRVILVVQVMQIAAVTANDGLVPAVSTGRCNTCIDTLPACFVVEGLSRSLVELS
jgi:hypothetical protein